MMSPLNTVATHQRRGRLMTVLTAAGTLTLGAQTMAQSQDFAAVAVDGRGAWGASLGQPTPHSAGRDALSRCAGRCRVVMTGRGRCVAFADSSIGGYWYGHAYGNSAGAVRDIALNGCAAGAPPGTCRIRHVNCL